MEIERLKYLRDTVIPHIEGMSGIEEWLEQGKRSSNSKIGKRAVLNFGWYCERGRATGNSISTQYDCGLEACLAGWYSLLAKRDELIGEDTLIGFDRYMLAKHFGISVRASGQLFASTGEGVEQESTYDTKEILTLRREYLDELIDSYDPTTT